MYGHSFIDERDRIMFTRLRLSSHNLNVEKGRWSRINREDRLCECGLAVQDESHILLDCPVTSDLRIDFNINRDLYENIGTLMESENTNETLRFMKCCMDKFN